MLKMLNVFLTFFLGPEAWRALVSQVPGVKSLLHRITIGYPWDEGPYRRDMQVNNWRKAFKKVEKMMANYTNDELNAFIGEHGASGDMLPGWRYSLHSHEMPLDLRVFQWCCRDNCFYECMHENVRERVARNEQTVHYYGKWPFLRIYGIQEIAPMLASLANAIFYVFYLWERLGNVNNFPYRRLWRVYGCVWCIAFLLSAVFHTRDAPITEALDYMSAIGGVIFTSFSSLVRIFLPSDNLSVKLVSLFLPIFLVYSYHVFYMNFVFFDYGYHMMCGVVAGLLSTILVCCRVLVKDSRTKEFAHISLRDVSFTDKCKTIWKGTKSHVWWAAIAQLSTWPGFLFEVLDFPPIYGILDSHTCWHLWTVYSTMINVQSMRDDEDEWLAVQTTKKIA